MAIQRNSISKKIDAGFAEHVDRGLSLKNKQFSSRYFYDERGSELFEAIMDLPEYYLTGCEYEILSTQSPQIANEFRGYKSLKIIELGAGNGLKTMPLLKAFESAGIQFKYYPIDVSSQALDAMSDRLLKEGIPKEKFSLVQGDYFRKLSELVGEEPVLLLYLGSNIGNYHLEGAHQLVSKLSGKVKANDAMLVGFDLQKDPNLISKAYNDSAGVTAKFNLNLLKRINKELGANFALDQFSFYSYYNPENGEVNSYLISLAEQDVFIDATQKTYSLERFEKLHTEISRKYTVTEIRELAESGGFELSVNYFDCKHYFTDSLWLKKD